MSDASAWVDACPNCDGTHYRERATKEPTYKCVCGETFEKPTRRWSKQRTPPHEREGGSALPLGEVRDAIRARDLSHVSTRMIGSDLPYDHREIGQALAELGDRGELSEWRRTTSRITWAVDDLAGES
jgi:hypothetical protein